MSIADLAAELDGGDPMTKAGIDVAGRRIGQRQAGQGRDPAGRVMRVGGRNRLA